MPSRSSFICISVNVSLLHWFVRSTALVVQTSVSHCWKFCQGRDLHNWWMCKFLLELEQLLSFLEVKHLFMPTTNIIYNDNKACVNWSKTCAMKGLRHIQMKENRIWENVQNSFIQICHVDGKTNLADLFTKEMRDTSHFVELRDLMLHPRLLDWFLLIVIYSCHSSLQLLRGVSVYKYCHSHAYM